jgi:hypothetical protein
VVCFRVAACRLARCRRLVTVRCNRGFFARAARAGVVLGKRITNRSGLDRGQPVRVPRRPKHRIDAIGHSAIGAVYPAIFKG